MDSSYDVIPYVVSIQKVVIDKTLPSGTRVTVRLTGGIYPSLCCTYTCMESASRVYVCTGSASGKLPRGEAVAPSVPRTHSGLYWGYNIRLASSLSAVFTESPYVVHLTHTHKCTYVCMHKHKHTHLLSCLPCLQ